MNWKKWLLASVILLQCGCAWNLRQDFIDYQNKLVGQNFDRLLRFDAKGPIGILRSDDEQKLRMWAVSENENIIDYEIIWRRTCKYVVTVDRHTRIVKGWHFASQDRTYCYTNP